MHRWFQYSVLVLLIGTQHTSFLDQKNDWFGFLVWRGANGLVKKA
jgi:hypothetical protein